MNEKEGIKLKKPQSIWTKPVKIKLKLFKSLFGLVKDAVTGNWPKLPGDALDTISGIELKTDIGERGWALVSRALSDAMLNLVDDYKYQINVDAVVSDDLDKNLNEILENDEHYMGFDFFENPKKIKLPEMVRPVYCDFLQCVGFDKAMAQNISRRLAGYFVLALMDEWRRNPEFYLPLEKRIKTPFDKAGQKEKEWMHYLAWLKKQVEEPVFSEPFSLKQIYIPLRSYYVEKKDSDGDKRPETPIDEMRESESEKRIVIDLEEEMSSWLKRADKEDALRVITGGPGYGKSSFLKIFAAKLAEQNVKVLFIQLHRFEIKDDLKEAIQRFIEYNEYLDHDPMGEDRLLLIFDGLDELAMQGKAMTDAANHFIREIKIKLANFNSTRTRILVLISFRDIIIQANESEFRNRNKCCISCPILSKRKNGRSTKIKTASLKKISGMPGGRTMAISQGRDTNEYQID
jgi:hypothetical protein